MIARIWDARTSSPHDTQSYQQVFDTEVLSQLSGVAGFRGAYLLAREDHGTMAIRTITLFESLVAVRRFAGESYQREHVTPRARATLLGSDPEITHFDVLSTHRPA
jgi:heme-degrading monooxygenase HmoA